MKKTTDVRNQSGFSEVAGLKIAYYWSSGGNEDPSSVRADFLKDELKVGTAYLKKDGTFYFSMDKPAVVDVSGQVSLTSQFLRDANEVLNPNPNA